MNVLLMYPQGARFKCLNCFQMLCCSLQSLTFDGLPPLKDGHPQLLYHPGRREQTDDENCNIKKKSNFKRRWT